MLSIAWLLAALWQWLVVGRRREPCVEVRFAKAVAQELAAKGVTVNSVSPGYVKTEMTDQIPQEIRDSIIQQVPMGRMATPDEIAYVVSFLTDDRNTYMTGANLPVNGGMYMT